MILPDTTLISRVERTVRRQSLFRPGDTLVVALSGGADSTFLLDLLSRLPGYDLRLVVAHLNHCLRGAASDADEEFCRESASRYAVPCETRRVNVGRLAEEGRLNLEDAGRRARIEFLDQIREKYGASAVALAHHADDQAETVLMRLLRGSGTTGLAGMAYRNDRGYVRPLLDISRPEIEAYLRLHGLGWREDGSNSDPAYLRNRIRHRLLPLLEEYNPAIRACLAATASLLGDDEILLEELTGQAFAGACRGGEGGVVCDIMALRALNTSLRRRVLRHAIRLQAGTLEGVGQCHVDGVCDLMECGPPNGRLALPNGVVVVREYDRLVVKRGEGECSENGFELLITAPGCYRLPSGGLLILEEAGSAVLPADPGTAYFDLARTPLPWLVRTFRPGDRMTPFGMVGTKKVKDIFIDRKIPLSRRRRIPLLFSGTALIWIGGVCASELSRVSVPSATVVRVTWCEENIPETD